MRKIIPVVAASATVLALTGGTLSYAALDKDVTVSVDGAATDISTRSSTVGDVLQDKGIAVGAHDVVAPALDTKVSDGTRIAVQYGRPVTVTLDGKPKTVWTTATRVDQALSALHLDTAGAALSTSRSRAIGREGLTLAVATQKTVTVNAAGTTRQLKTTARTVGEVLKTARITVDADDRLSARPATAVTDGSKVVYTRVDKKTVTKKQDIAFDTVTKRTRKLDKGDTSVDTSGRRGERTLTFQEVRHNGTLVSTEKTGSKVTEKPRTKVVLVGTKEQAEKSTSSKSSSNASESRSAARKSTSDRSESKSSKPKSSKSTSDKKKSSKSKSKSDKPKSKSDKKKSRKSSSAPSVGSGSVWDKLAKCESGGNWSINTGNGFYGGLQFTKSTWRAFGGSGMPNHASRSRQIAVAKKVKASQGWGAWPGCTKKLGLR